MNADVLLRARAQVEGLPAAEAQTRLSVVGEALAWVGTPYHHQGRIKGAGVDCGMILLEVFEALGLLPHIDPRPYPPDWHLHRSEEAYLGWVKQYAREVETPLPGDVVLYQFGRCISHGAIVTAWPEVVHSYVDRGVIRGVSGEEPLEPHRFAGAWTVIGRGE